MITPTGPAAGTIDHEPMSAARMRQLLADGHATPLLPGYFPVPAKYGDTWWYAPSGDPQHRYVPASTDQAEQFEHLASRRHAAKDAVANNDRARTP
jgi:hypothetical protein